MTKFFGFFLLVFMLGSVGAMASSGNKHGDLDSTVLHCYTEHDEDLNPSGDMLQITRHSKYDDWRYRYELRINGKTAVHDVRLQRAEHLEGKDWQPISKFELLKQALMAAQLQSFVRPTLWL